MVESTNQFKKRLYKKTVTKKETVKEVSKPAPVSVNGGEEIVNSKLSEGDTIIMDFDSENEELNIKIHKADKAPESRTES